MNNYDDLFDRSTNKESLEDKKTKQNIAALEDIFKNSVNFEEDTINFGASDNYLNVSGKTNDSANFVFSNNNQKNEPPVDLLEKTSEIGNVDLETLRNYSKMLHEQIDEPKETTQSSGANNKGKVLVKASEHFKNSSNDINEILQAFISCSILSLVTAGMGVGWLLYIIMHI